MSERRDWVRPALSRPLAKELTGSRSNLWTVAAVLPEQFHNAASSPYHGRPEAALMHAVLEDAVNCVLSGLRATNRREQRLAREAEEWLLRDDVEWPFSFLNICTVLGLEPHYIRRGLQRWHQQGPPWTRRSKRRVVRSRNPIRLARIAA